MQAKFPTSGQDGMNREYSQIAIAAQPFSHQRINVTVPFWKRSTSPAIW